MKFIVTNRGIVVLLAVAVSLLAGCFSPWKGDTGTVTLYLGNEGLLPRLSGTWPPDTDTKSRLEHTVVFSSDGRNITLSIPIGQTFIRTELLPGYWEIALDAFLYGEHYAKGSAGADIEAGKPKHVTIVMQQVEMDCIPIWNLDQLMAIGDELDKKYKLVNDIITTPLTVPIGSENNAFTGTLDGNWKTIDFDMKDPLPKHAGLFAKIGPGGVVKNLRLTGSIVETSGSANDKYAGAVAGENNGKISNVASSVRINIGTNIMPGSIGGMAGINNENGEIRNCFGSGLVSAVNGYDAGGIAGQNQGLILNCYSTGDITSINGSGGGIVGRALNGSILYCWSDGVINSNAVGGIAGYGIGQINHCVAMNSRFVCSINTTGRIWGVNTESMAAGIVNYGRNNINLIIPIEWVNSPSGKDGESFEMADANGEGWWKETVGWDSVWGGNSEERPWVWNSLNSRPKLWYE